MRYVIIFLMVFYDRSEYSEGLVSFSYDTSIAYGVSVISPEPDVEEAPEKEEVLTYDDLIDEWKKFQASEPLEY